RFRALRYRLSRSWWHGIRGGSDDPGWGFAAQYIGRHALSAFTAFIVFPWAATRLWNLRWNAMSFGPLPFRANLTTAGLKRHWALLYLAPVGLLLLGFVAMGSMFAAQGKPDPSLIAIFAILFLLFYLAIPLLTLHFFAKLYRQAAAATTLGELEFEFDATTWDWLKLFLGNIALVIVTLGFGLTFWGYRNWSFMVRHTRLLGAIDVSALTQSTAHSPGEAEGFADMLDIGAI
ncbi:MAG: DUF898 family protein, partial [Sphingomicrobium sp.]